ncbi:putative transcriptional regulator [Desulfitispora alkaliphila]|uniref:helix-turn-helix domain-containing protein n=1 Tax=Desulfitispora alkaliphila TaxID=622674 RepID=UPI003D21A124
MSIEIKLKKLLEQKNKSQYWLSKQTGISTNAIGKLFRNETTSITFENLEKVYNALGCKSFDELFEIVDKEDN